MKQKKGYVLDGLNRINSKIRNEVMESPILPILSDPTNKDGDGDGIKDNLDKEPLKKNTIETLYPLTTKNKDTNQIYIKIKDNLVTITAHINFTGDANDIFSDTTKNYADVAVNGIKTKWNKNKSNPIIGTDYDFIDGLKDELITNVIYHIPGETYYDKIGQKYLDIHINNTDPGYWDGKLWGIFGEEHIPHMEGGWSVDDVGRITMYKKDQRNTDAYTEFEYGATLAHEFGHTLGLGDAYLEVSKGLVLGNNAEISKGVFGISGSIMYSNEVLYEPFLFLGGI